MTDRPPLRLPARQPDAHKGTFGKVLLLGGSRGMSGSIAMSAIAALHGGSGLVSAAVPDRCLETVASFHPAVMTIPLPDEQPGVFSLEAAERLPELVNSSDAIGIGPGMTTHAGSLRLVERILSAPSLKRVFDADALNALAQLDWHDRLRGEAVLTPHPGEFARLSGIKPSDRAAQIVAARALADKLEITIVLKGGPTEVLSPGQAWTCPTGNPGMATGGSGDVLTGLITSLLGQGLSACDASRLGVWIHGVAGDRAAERTGQAGMTAMTLLEQIPDALRRACQ